MEKEEKRRHFTSAPPSVNSTSIDQWEINALTAAVKCLEVRSKKCTRVASDSEANEDTHGRAHLYPHQHTHTHIQGQLNKKQINRVSLR